MLLEGGFIFITFPEDKSTRVFFILQCDCHRATLFAIHAFTKRVNGSNGRIGGLASSSLIARQIAVYEMVFCASPDYLAKHQIPLSLNDLTDHQCLGFSYGDVQASLALQIDTQAFDKQHSRLTSNSGQALKVATLKGAGILLQPRLLLSEDLVRGELIEILSDQVPTPSPIHLMYKSKALSLKTRVFIEFVMAAMSK
ncbi:LysR substrate-binding domain-containing protein [Shewanella benthica]|uniref:Hypothetical transcriptional regulator, LysR family protein n=1 Tax=Shewanella benthica KT99 TaxID=314608 RepID=A9CV77_9GAMM|nr:LysR substrate-binding domain-containing protein [Shewanella benthica]EDQ02809.1 Hypothetical transcriptional regulator, LysR family protein [Shewanella benthica KT99]